MVGLSIRPGPIGRIFRGLKIIEEYFLAMGRLVGWNIEITGNRTTVLTMGDNTYRRGDIVSATDWLAVGSVRRAMYLRRHIVEMLPRPQGRPKGT